MSNPYGWGQNEPQIKPKDQGGDTIATFSQKIYNLFDNLFNTLNSYPWSAATQSDAGYMSAADKAALDDVPTTYLPKSTLTSGTWTPVLYGDTTEGALTYLAQQGAYRKVGNVCFIAFRIGISGYTTLPAGKVRIKGIPYAANNNSGAYNFGSVITSGAGAYQKLRAGVVRDSFVGIRSVDASNFQIIDDATWGANSSDTGGVKIFPTSGTIFGFASYFTA